MIRAFLTGLPLLLYLTVFGQETEIILGPDEIGENQAWTITVTVKNGELKSAENFPDIQGFRKRGTSKQSQTSIINGQMSSSQSVIMTYTPTQQGTFTLPAFKMKVNDQIVSVNGKKIKVGAPAQQPQRDPFQGIFGRDPFDDMFGREATEFVDVKEDALLALTTSKDEVYVGEGFNVTLSFLVSEDNRAPMQFHDLGNQLSGILKKLKPSNCWEENFNIENIEGESIEINGKGYTQYKIYQAIYYPLNTEPIVFPSVGLEMIKYKVAKNPSFFGQNRQENFKTFYSKAKTIQVKDLPPHPLKSVVGVGNYKLTEKISSPTARAGMSVEYDFMVVGEGNISSIEKPNVLTDSRFDFYEPNIRQSVNRENSRVTGTKAFSYFVIPKEPGTYDLKDFFQWVFFNPQTKKYDTLRSQLSLNVTGESQRNLAIESSDHGSFYDRIDATPNTLQSSLVSGWSTPVLNVILVMMMAGTVFLIFRKQ
jgi:BatD DUF11 like domain